MADSDDSKSQFSGLIGPGLIIVIGGLVAYFSFEPRLESLRPDLAKRLSVPPPPSPAGLHALHARLWDDPLTAAYQHSQQHRRETAKLIDLTRPAPEAVRLNTTESNTPKYFQTVAESVLGSGPDGKGEFLCLPVLVPGGPYDDDTEERKRITYAVVSALWSCGYELSYPDRVSYVEVPVLVDIRAVRERVPVERLVVPT